MSAKVLNESAPPTANGGTGKFIENIDPDDPDYRRDLQRPADVKEDMRQMEGRQRVSSILNSDAFREELEAIIADQLKHGPHPASMIALQQISDLLLPNTNSRWQQVSQMGKANINSDTTGGSVLIPINDIRGIDTLNYAKGERIQRCKLASLYRILDLYGWTSGISNHISVRLGQELEQFLINPFGLLYHETTASSLIKVNSSGTVVEQGSTTYGVNKPAFSLHSAIYKARPDIKCAIHVRTSQVTAISSMKCGLLPISQEAISCGQISYHEFRGVLGEEDVKRLLDEDLGPVNKVMFLRNHGVIACGETIEEACHYLFNVMSACQIQSQAMVCGLDNLHIPSQDTQRKMLAMNQEMQDSLTVLENKKWKCGELEFEALMRCLDNAGYRTGYMYRQPIMRTIDRNAIKEVEIPPAAISHSFDAEYVRKMKEEKQKLLKGEWLTSPNTYARQETEETGTQHPKKITKWVPDSSPAKTSTPVRIENKNQFAPQGIDPKELKNHQKQIKQDRYEDKKSAGFQSKILDNLNQNGNKEATESNVDATDSSKESLNKQSTDATSGSVPGVSSTIVFGAASKGIIKRDQQNNVGVYKTFYAAANPFQQMDAGELEKYKKEIAQKQIREQEGVELHNKSDVITTESSKKKSHTIPRSKSLLDKKHEKGDNLKSTSGGSESSSPQSSRDSSPSKHHHSHHQSNSSPKSPNGADPHSSASNKSATIPANMSSASASEASKSGSKSDKPKKKSKLSFLSRSKKAHKE